MGVYGCIVGCFTIQGVQMSVVDKALKLLDQQEQEVVKKFWRFQKDVQKQERQLKRRNIIVRRY